MAHKDDIDQVYNIMQLYFDAARTADTSIVSGYFHKDAQMQGVFDGVVVSTPISKLWEDLARLGPQTEAISRVQILSVEVHRATARFAFRSNDESGNGMMDVFTLAKGADGWVVMNKIFENYSGSD